MTANTNLIKETGATFTPLKLANFISDKIISYLNPTHKKLHVLDPACGEGILLNSISKKLVERKFEFKLHGFDSNKNFLKIASKNLNDFSSSDSLSLNHGDFLKEIQPEVQQISLSFDPAASKLFINNTMDIVIANPPYVRTQILGADYAQSIAKKFNLKGRVDLYYPFLLAMTYALKEDGLIGVITSNRYLSTKSGMSVRKFLEQNYEILEVIDLGDTKLFDAAVLPAIFIGRKKKSFNQVHLPRFTKIYEELNGYNGDLNTVKNIYDVLSSPVDGYFKILNKKYKKTSGLIKFIETRESNWGLFSTEEAKWINKLTEASQHTVSDFFKVRIGIKTTADKVFIRENWDLETNHPEEVLLKDLISQENIKTWGLSNDKQLKVLYPHFSNNGKKATISLDDFPKAKQYLEEHKERLSSRKYLIKAGRKWYEIWVPQNPALWKKPKLVFPDISVSPRFYFDESGRIVNGNCYWMVAQSPKEIDLLLLIQGIANSKLMTKYHDLMFNNKLYSGRRRYFSQFVEKYPLPNPASEATQQIISITKQLNHPLLNDKTELIEELEIAVAAAFNVEPII